MSRKQSCNPGLHHAAPGFFLLSGAERFSRARERCLSGESVLDYFDTDVVLTIDRLTELAPILNLSAVAREAGINVQTLQAKIRRRTLLTGDETRRIVNVLKRHHLVTVA